MFIKLSKIEDHTPFREDWFFTVYINMDKVTEFYRISRFGKSFTNVSSDKEILTVRETPEEIMKLIEEAGK